MMRKVSFFFVVILLSVQLWAKNESTSSYPVIGSKIVTGRTVSHADPYFNMTGTPSFKDRSIVGSVELKLDVNKQTAINVGEVWTYEVAVKASFYTITGQLINGIAVEKTLIVEQNAVSGMKAADLDAINMEGAYRVMAEIKSVKVTKKTGTSSTDITTGLPSFISVRTAIQVERFYNFDPTVIPYSSGGLTHEHNTAAKSLEMHWDYLLGAEEYELEYTYIDDYKVNNSVELTYDFKNNATRIVTQNNSYTIPVLYDKGYLIYRVRGVGRTGDQLQTNLFGKWSNNTDQGNVSNFEASHKFTIAPDNDLISKNWQYNVDFAEEGKRKDHIVYYDGSLRMRQQQTINNSEKEVIVGETIYDHVGRPVIATLPVPVKAEVDNHLYFKPKFTQNTQGNKYSKEDFDKPDPEQCSDGPKAMGTNSGAAYYYSSTNTNKEGKNAYIPDAKGYPFTQVEYMPDATGRINRQSGVGIDHKLSSTHETKYSYATPSQVELDAMFGLDAGINTHYRKNVVRDPNGQLSVSYLDMSGKVVATCLIGQNPAALSAVYDYEKDGDKKPVYDVNGKLKTKDRITKKETLINDTKPYDPNKGGSYNPNVVQNGTSLAFTHLLVVDTDNTPVKITYEVTPQKLEGLKCLAGEALNVCYDCVYDLEIIITDACGEEKYNSTKDNNNAKLKVGNILNPKSCEGVKYALAPSINKTLLAGTYTITKVLTVNEESINTYVNEYMSSYKQVCSQEFKNYEQEYSAQNGINCSQLDPCKACVEDLGISYTEHVGKYGVEALTERNYYRELQGCKELCGNTELNQTIYKMLLADVSPGGQYACTKLDDECSNTSVLKTNNRLGANYLGFGNWRSPYFNVLQQKPGDLPTVASLSTEESKKHYYDEYGEVVYIPISVNYTELKDDPKFVDFTFEPNVWHIDESGTKSALGTIYLVTYATEAKTLASGKKVEPGQIEKIELVAHTAYKNFYNDILPNQSYAIEPSHLHELTDFTDKWQESWAASLVMAHPEFCYYAYRVNTTEKVVTDFNYTSEEFDEIISTKTLTEITNADGVEIGNYFEGRVAKRNLFTIVQAQDLSNVDFLLKHDPYFKSPTSGDVLKLMLDKLKGINSKDNIDVRQRIAASNRIIPSNRIPEDFTTKLTEAQQKEVLAGSTAPPAGTMSYENAKTQFLIDLSFQTGELDNNDERELDWRAYVSQYLSFKNEIIKDRANAYCDQKGSPSTTFTLPYGNNACIGAEKFNPFMNRGYSFIRWWYFEFIKHRFAPCGWRHHALYRNKTKRYNKQEDAKYDEYGNEIVADAQSLLDKQDTQHYLATGQYPLLRDLEVAISNIAQKSTSFKKPTGAAMEVFHFTGKNKNYMGQSLFDYFSYGQPMPYNFKDYRYAIHKYSLSGTFDNQAYGSGTTTGSSHLGLNFVKTDGTSTNNGCGKVDLYLPDDVNFKYKLYKNIPDPITKTPHSAEVIYKVPITFKSAVTAPPTDRKDGEDGTGLNFASRNFEVVLKNISNFKFVGSYVDVNNVKKYKFIAKAAFQILIVDEVDPLKKSALSTMAYTIKGETCIPIDGSVGIDPSKTCIPSAENIALVDLLNGLAGTRNLYCGNNYVFDNPLNDQNRVFEETYNPALNKYILGSDNISDILLKKLNIECSGNTATLPSGNNTDTSEDELGEINGEGNAGPAPTPTTAPNNTNTNTVPTNSNTLSAGNSVTLKMPYGTNGYGFSVELKPVLNQTSLLQSVVLTNIQGFTDLKESIGNTFTITAWINNGGALIPITFTGTITMNHGVANQDFENFNFKDCGAGIPLECDNEPNRNRVDLEQMLNELSGNDEQQTDLNAYNFAVFTNLSDNGPRFVDLTKNPTFQKRFKYKFSYLPVDQPTALASAPVNSNTPVSLDETKKPLYANGMLVQVKDDAGSAENTGKHLTLTIGNRTASSNPVFTAMAYLKLDLSATGILFSDIVGFRNLRATSALSVMNPSGKFTITAMYYKDNDYRTTVLSGSASLPLGNCDPGCDGVGANELINGDFKDPAFESGKRTFNSDFNISYKDAPVGGTTAYIAQKAPNRHRSSGTAGFETDHTGGLNHMLVLEYRPSTEGAQNNNNPPPSQSLLENKLWYQNVTISKGKDYIFQAYVSNTSQIKPVEINAQHELGVKLGYKVSMMPDRGGATINDGFIFNFKATSAKLDIISASIKYYVSVVPYEEKLKVIGTSTVEHKVPSNNVTRIDLKLLTKQYGLITLDDILSTTDKAAYDAVLDLSFDSQYRFYTFVDEKVISPYYQTAYNSGTTPKVKFYYKYQTDANNDGVQEDNEEVFLTEDKDIFYYDQGWHLLVSQLEFPWADNDPQNKEIEVGIIVDDLGYFRLAFDDISLRTDCGVQVDAEELTVVDNCEAYKEVVADINTEYFNVELEAKTRARIQKQYIDKCLTAAEKMVSEMDQFSYQYTLYYYDQSGNLVKTVPPLGVKLITDEVTLKKIDQLRDDGKYDLRYVPQHTMATTYRYNSLNQLVSQSLPDHEQFNIWDLENPTEPAHAIDPNLTVKDVEFFGKPDGVLLANNSADVSTIYVTGDEAKKWNKVTKLGVKDINAVQYVDANTAIAVLNEGKLLKSADKGRGWVLYNTNTESDLVGLDFIVNGDNKLEGMIIDRQGNISTTADIETGTWHEVNQVTGKPEGLHYIKSLQKIDQTTVYYVVANVSLSGYPAQKDYLYKLTLAGGNWTWTLIEIRPGYKINKFLINGNTLIAVGDRGLVSSRYAHGLWNMEFILNGSNLTEIDANSSGELVVKDAQNNLTKRSSDGAWSNYLGNIVSDISGAFVDVTGKSYKQNDLTLESSFYLGTTPKTVKLFDGYVGTTTAGRAYETYVTSDNKLQLKPQTGASPIPVPTPLQLNSTVTKIAAWAESWDNGSAIVGDFRGMYIGASNKVYNIYHGTAVEVTYQNGNDQLVLKHISPNQTQAFRESNGSVIQTMLAIATDINGNNAKIYTLTYGVAVPTAVFKADLPAEINVDDITAFGYDLGSIEIALGANIYHLFGGSWSTSKFYGPELKGMSYKAGVVTIAAANGAIVKHAINNTYAELLYTKTPLANYEDLAIDPSNGNGVAVTANGVYKLSGWTAGGADQTVPETEAIKTIIEDGTGTYYIGSNRNIYAYSTSGTFVKATADNVAVLDMAKSGTEVVAVGNSGSIAYKSSTGWSLPMQVEPLKLCALSVSPVAGSEVVYAIGKAGTLIKSEDKGVTWEAIKNKASTDFRAIAAINDQVAYMGGFDGKIYKVDHNNVTVVASGYKKFRDAYYSKGILAFVTEKDVNAGPQVIWSTDFTTFSSETVATGGNNLNALYVYDENYLYLAGNAGTLVQLDMRSTATPKVKLLKQTSGANWTSYNLKDITFTDYNVGYAIGENGTILKTINRGETWINKSVAGQTANYVAIAAMDANHFYLASQDGTQGGGALLTEYSDKISTRFWYDKLGRLIASQNTKQYKASGTSYGAEGPAGAQAFSYTLYDALGRPYESGELLSKAGLCSGLNVSDEEFTTWLNSNGNLRREIIRTYYTNPQFVLNIKGFEQDNLNDRVASVTYQKFESRGYQNSVQGDYDHAYHFTYDNHGNVSTFVTENTLMGNFTGHRFKTINYGYDLVSGKTNELVYQKGESDQLMYRYKYDSDNKITSVYSSKDGVFWANDASYEYYRHGPLARLELGDHNIQGLDYVYTLKGWIKGLNSTTLINKRDVGKDGNLGVNQNFLKDEVGYSLGYYLGDYKTIDNTLSNNPFPDRVFESTENTNSIQGKAGDNLYNGNITSMVTGIKKFIDDAPENNKDIQIMYSAYKYDQLNRLEEVQKFSSPSLLADNTWINAFSTSAYNEKFSYDKNGNITEVERKDAVGVNVDKFHYNYHNLANGYLSNTNRLSWVDDAVEDSRSTEDIDDQNKDNYVYDEIGNLIKDEKEGIEEIKWNVAGKVTEVQRTALSSLDKSSLIFGYDALGKRSYKIVNIKDNQGQWHQKITFYIRDVLGNVISHYSYEPDNGQFKLDEYDLYGSGRIGALKVDKVLKNPKNIINIPPVKYDANNINHILLQGNADYIITEGQQAFIVDGTTYSGNLMMGEGSFLYVLGKGTPNSITHTGNSTVGVYGELKIGTMAMQSKSNYFNYGTLQVLNNWNVVNGTYVQNEHIMVIEGSISLEQGSTLFNRGKISVGGNLEATLAYVQLWSGYTQIGQNMNLSGSYLDFKTDASLIVSNLSLSNGAQVSNIENTGFAEMKVLQNLDLAIGTKLKNKIRLCVQGAITGASVIESTVEQHACDRLEFILSNESRYINYLGEKSFEMTNHLTNVLAIVTDKKTKVNINGEINWISDVSSATDYYAFGSSLRSVGSYKYGFNGKEKDVEGIGGGQATYDYGFRIYNPSLARFLSIDPLFKGYAWYTPYQFAGNKPIVAVDLDGLEEQPANNSPIKDSDPNTPPEKPPVKNDPPAGSQPKTPVQPNAPTKVEQTKKEIVSILIYDQADPAIGFGMKNRPFWDIETEGSSWIKYDLSEDNEYCTTKDMSKIISKIKARIGDKEIGNIILVAHGGNDSKEGAVVIANSRMGKQKPDKNPFGIYTFIKEISKSMSPYSTSNPGLGNIILMTCQGGALCSNDKCYDKEVQANAPHQKVWAVEDDVSCLVQPQSSLNERMAGLTKNFFKDKIAAQSHKANATTEQKSSYPAEFLDTKKTARTNFTGNKDGTLTPSKPQK